MSARLFLTALLMASTLAAVAAPLPLSLKETATVAGPRIRLGDIADGGQAAPLASDVGATPLPGYALRLSRQEIGRLLRARGLADQVSWSGAEAVVVDRLLAPFNSARIAAAAEEYLRGRLGADIVRADLQLVQPMAELQLPAGHIALTPRPLSAEQALHRQVTVWVDILVDGAPVRAVNVAFQVRAYRPTLVAARDLAAGVAPPCDALRLAEVDVAGLDSPPAGADCAALGGRLKRPLAAGAPLLAAQLRHHYAVAQGDSVNLRLAAGAIVLESRATALADGDVGQRIEVQPAAAAQPISVEVTGPGAVTLAGK